MRTPRVLAFGKGKRSRCANSYTRPARKFASAGGDVNIEIRPCRDQDEMQAYARNVAYVFANNSENTMADELSTTQPDWTTCAFVDGQLATTMGAFPFTVRLNGAPVHMGGVTAVGTLPQYRRKGLLRRVMRQGLETMRERNQSLAILWASMAAIYQRFGYGLAASQVTYTFDPRFAQLRQPHETSGRISLLNTDEAYLTIKQLYIQYATARNLHIHRAKALWDESALRPKNKEKVYVAIYHNDDGEPRGYIVYRTKEGPHSGPGPDQVLSVADFAALDMDAYLALWEYIRGHDLVGKVEMSNVVGVDDPAPDLLLEPRMLNRRTSDAIWMRVVDAEQALPQRPYGDRGELVISLPADDMCPWNAGSYLMETDGRTTDVRRTDRRPDITVTPNALASLISGHSSATHLARAGLIEALDERGLQTADRLFATTYAPHCPNSF
jgi:predicted acetyltransferase